MKGMFLSPLLFNPREMMAKPAPIKFFSQPSPDTATFHTSGKPTGPPFVLTQNLSIAGSEAHIPFCSRWWLKGLQNYGALY